MTPADNESSPRNISENYRKFLLGIFKQRDFADTSRAIVDDSFALLRADRVSLTLRKGAKSRVVAVSGSLTVQQHSTLVIRTRKLSEAAIRADETVIYGLETEAVPQAVVEQLAEFLSETHSGAGIIWPFRSAGTSTCLILEFADAGSCREAVKQLEQLKPLLELSVENAVNMESVLFETTRRRMSRLVGIVGYSRVRKILAGILVCMLLVLVMSTIRVPYVIRADGVSFPVQRHRVFAPDDGNVSSIDVRDGDVVERNRKLVQLTSHELNIEQLIAQNEIAAKQKLIATLRTQVSESVNVGSRADAVRAESDLVRERIALEAAEQRLSRITDELSALNVVAPSNGTIVTFDLHRRLRGRPVNRGELLLEVMDTSGDWEVKLKVQEQRWGHLKSAIDRERSVTVQFVAAGTPDRLEWGEITSYGHQTLTDPEIGSYVPVTVLVGSHSGSDPVVGAEVSARIAGVDCTLLYYVFGDVYDAIQRRWF